jgi:hypothetical protein
LQPLLAIITIPLTVHALPITDFVLTQGLYLDTANMDVAVKQEFGANATVADWSTIAASFSQNIELFCSTVGLLTTDAWVYDNGQGWWNSYRHYFVEVHNHTVPPNWLVHSEIDNDYVDLGSWYGFKIPILVDLNSPPTPTVPEPSTILLFGAGLAGLGLARRRAKK